MLKDIYANLQLNRYEIKCGAILIFGMFIFGEIISAIVMVATGGDGKYVPIGMALVLMMATTLTVICGVGQYATGLDIAIRSGATRHRYMRSQTITSLLQCLMALGLVLVGWLVDAGIYKLFFASGNTKIDIVASIPLWILAVAPLVITAASLIFGTALAKFGKKAIFAFLTIYFVAIFMVGRVGIALEGNSTNIIDKVIFAVCSWAIAVGWVPILWICAAIVAVLAVASYCVMLRMPVKS